MSVSGLARAVTNVLHRVGGAFKRVLGGGSSPA
jgi:hypothetical protein